MPNKCLVPHCHKDAKTRGLCGTCYQSASIVVREGTTTWAELEALGLARHFDKKARRRLFADALSEIKSKETPDALS